VEDRGHGDGVAIGRYPAAPEGRISVTQCCFARDPTARCCRRHAVAALSRKKGGAARGSVRRPTPQSWPIWAGI
jgi:hypothetical protein